MIYRANNFPQASKRTHTRDRDRLKRECGKVIAQISVIAKYAYNLVNLEQFPAVCRGMLALIVNWTCLPIRCRFTLQSQQHFNRGNYYVRSRHQIIHPCGTPECAEQVSFHSQNLQKTFCSSKRIQREFRFLFKQINIQHVGMKIRD